MQECLSKDDGGTTFALSLHLHALFVALTFLRDILSLADEYVDERNRVLEATTERHVIRFRPKGDSAVCTAWLSGFALPDALERDDLAAFCGWRRPIIGDLRLLGGDDGLEIAALRAAVLLRARGVDERGTEVRSRPRKRDDIARAPVRRHPVVGHLRCLWGGHHVGIMALRAAVDADVGVECGPDLERHLVATRADTPLLVAAAEVRG